MPHAAFTRRRVVMMCGRRRGG